MTGSAIIGLPATAPRLLDRRRIAVVADLVFFLTGRRP